MSTGDIKSRPPEEEEWKQRSSKNEAPQNYTHRVNKDTWQKISHCSLLWIRAAAYTVKNISNSDTHTATHTHMPTHTKHTHSWQYTECISAPDFIIHSKWEFSNNSHSWDFTFYDIFEYILFTSCYSLFCPQTLWHVWTEK